MSQQDKAAFFVRSDRCALIILEGCTNMTCNKCHNDFEGDFCPVCATPAKSSRNSLLGFRSNKLWKKIISILYLTFCALQLLVLLTAGRKGMLTTQDFLVDKLFSLLMLLLFLSPYIFLSNTKLRNYLPLFKKRKLGTSIAGLTIVIIVFLIIIGFVNQLHSEEYLADQENHAYVEVSSTPATCEQDGRIEYLCEYCATTEVKTVSASGHIYIEKSHTPATCDSNGCTIKECINCGKTEETIVQATGHTMTEISRENPTDTETGYIINACSTCGKQETVELSEIPQESQSTESTKAEKEELDAKKNESASNAGISLNAFENMLAACDAIGIEYEKISNLEGMDNWANGKRCSFDFSGYNFLVYFNQDETVNSINSGTVKFYENGQKVEDLKNRLITTEEKSQLKIWAEDHIKQILKSPSTAKFPGSFFTPFEDWSFAKNGSNYTVSSYVDSQNGFGAMIRSQFTIVYEWKDGTGKVTSLIFDGERII